MNQTLHCPRGMKDLFLSYVHCITRCGNDLYFSFIFVSKRSPHAVSFSVYLSHIQNKCHSPVFWYVAMWRSTGEAAISLVCSSSALQPFSLRCVMALYPGTLEQFELSRFSQVLIFLFLSRNQCGTNEHLDGLAAHSVLRTGIEPEPVDLQPGVLNIAPPKDKHHKLITEKSNTVRLGSSWLGLARLGQVLIVADSLAEPQPLRCMQHI